MNKLKSSHLNIFEISTILISIVLISLGISLSHNLVYHNVISSQLFKIGNAKEGKAKRKTERSFFWSEIDHSEDVYNNDQIFTSVGETLNVELVNASRLEINPSSLIRVFMNTSNDLGIRIDRGTLKLNARKVKQIVHVAQGGTLVELQRGAKVRLEKIGSVSHGVKLLKGKATIIKSSGSGQDRFDMVEGDAVLVKSQETQSTVLVNRVNGPSESIEQFNHYLKLNGIKYVLLKPVNTDAQPIKLKVGNGGVNIKLLGVGKYIVSSAVGNEAIYNIEILPSYTFKRDDEPRLLSLLEKSSVDITSQSEVKIKTNDKVKNVFLKPADDFLRPSKRVQKINVRDAKIDVSSLIYGKYLISISQNFKEFDILDIVASKKNPIIIKSDIVDYEEPIEVRLELRRGLRSRLIVEYPKLSKIEEYIIDENKITLPSYNQKSIKLTVIPLTAGIRDALVNDGESTIARGDVTFQKDIFLKFKKPYELNSVKSRRLDDQIVTTIKLNRPLVHPNHKVRLVHKNTKEMIPLLNGEQGGVEALNLKSGKYDLEVINEELNLRLMEWNIEIEDSVVIKKKKVKNKQEVILSTFSWYHPGELSSFSKDKDFEYLVELYDSSMSLILKTQQKKNTFEFEGNNNDKYKIKISKIRAGKVIPLGDKLFTATPPENVSPKRIKNYVMKYDPDSLCYRVELPHYLTAYKFFVEIYHDESMKNFVREIWANKPSFCWSSNRDGKYFFRYKYIDYWGKSSDYSKISEIIFPISPMLEF